MKTIEATFRVVTPMFLGGADHSVTDGIRAPTIKGALRFWWRALNWGPIYLQCNNNLVDALKKLHADEARLFGAAAKTIDKKQAGGQGAFILNVQRQERDLANSIAPDVNPGFHKLLGARYLGYGVIGQVTRSCITEAQAFTVVLRFRGEPDASILQALKVFGLLGALGSRARHGMGSVAVQSIQEDTQFIWHAPATSTAYQTEIRSLLGDFVGVPLPEYSAFSAESRVDWLLTATTPFRVLDQFGKNLLDYRSWGQTNNGNILPSGKASEKRFKDDHDWLRDSAFRAAKPSFHPRRVMFGLPHDYGQGHLQKVNAENFERRASPLLFHVHEISRNEFIGISVFLKSRFLPDREKIKARGMPVDAKVDDWSVITDFLDGKVGNPATAFDRFPGKTAVLP